MSVALLLGFIFASMVDLAQIQGGAVQLGGKDNKNTEDIQRLH